MECVFALVGRVAHPYFTSFEEGEPGRASRCKHDLKEVSRRREVFLQAAQAWCKYQSDIKLGTLGTMICMMLAMGDQIVFFATSWTKVSASLLARPASSSLGGTRLLPSNREF
jgi:hypothetical protein